MVFNFSMVPLTKFRDSAKTLSLRGTVLIKANKEKQMLKDSIATPFHVLLSNNFWNFLGVSSKY